MMTDDDLETTASRPTRRQFVGGMTAGLLATLAPAGLAQMTKTDAAAGGSHDPAELPDYPKPPFQAQQQEWPGLTSKMTPRPDHGEKTYRGNGRLAGRKALITGGDSGMGRAAAIAFARRRRRGDQLPAARGAGRPRSDRTQRRRGALA